MEKILKQGIVPIRERGGYEVVSARELFAYLGVNERFSKWFDRMKEYGFEEHNDYLVYQIVRQVPHQGGFRTLDLIDYSLSMDCAKEIAMLQRTEKGKEIRQYFIQSEKELRQALRNTHFRVNSPVPALTKDGITYYEGHHIRKELGLSSKSSWSEFRARYPQHFYKHVFTKKIFISADFIKLMQENKAIRMQRAELKIMEKGQRAANLNLFTDPQPDAAL